MERKVGEVFEVNGKWYQCLESSSCRCDYCDFDELGDCDIIACASGERKDGKEVHFKKLEKVGEPYMLEDKKFQKYKVFKTPYIYHKIDCSWQSFSDPYYISLEIKEDMEENYKSEDTLLTRLVGRYVNNLIDYETFEKAVKELYSDKNDSKPTLKEFDLKAAKAGKPVCTRDGRRARIICFDMNSFNNHIIVALITEENGTESIYSYTSEGKWKETKTENDLMLLEKKEGWVNLYKNQIHDTLESAEEGHKGITDYIKTIRVEWEE